MSQVSWDDIYEEAATQIFHEMCEAKELELGRALTQAEENEVERLAADVDTSDRVQDLYEGMASAAYDRAKYGGEG